MYKGANIKELQQIKSEEDLMLYSGSGSWAAYTNGVWAAEGITMAAGYTNVAVATNALLAAEAVAVVAIVID
ncbi:hypothetical protein CCS79_17290 [Clostridium diolis]|uniref:hypothetical protein n=1 Tax=Clostridium diolis TaxID=223919 RepID=UPI000B3FD3CC|nr:hypothetical protein [Clostridium diolis]OVE66733.1 hypothetical protein CCS79_17290 [Clostridium diolis]